jgi:PAP2 superfamily
VSITCEPEHAIGVEPAQNAVEASIAGAWLLRAIRNAHYPATLVLILALPSSLRAVHLPFHFAWRDYFVNFWIVFAFRSVVGAAMLFTLGCPKQFRSWLDAPRNSAPFSFQLRDAIKRVGSVIVPAAYLFIGLVVAFSYNDVIACLRFNGSADFLLNRADARIMGGITVSSLAHLVAAHVPPQAFDVMTWIYFLLFPALGSCLVFLALQRGVKQAWQFVGALLTSYYVVLGCFYILPAVGPFVICSDHFSVFSRSLKMYAGQYDYLNVLRGYAEGQRPPLVGAHYFAAFPCMHLVQPLIALAFLRPWRRIAATFLAFNVILIPCILLLEQHYVVDLIGAVPLAILAVAMMGASGRSNDLRTIG